MAEVWINAGTQFVTTILASAVSVWIALHIYKKEAIQADLDKKEIKEANTSSALSFIDFACASLFYLSPGPKTIECKVSSAKIELEKIQIVNATLKEIKSSDIINDFIQDYQNCKIILQILEVEIKSLLEDLSGDTYKSNYFSKIDIERRTEMLYSITQKYSKYTSIR